MMQTILYFYDRAGELVAKSIPISRLRETNVSESLIRMKYDVPNDDLSAFDDYRELIDRAVGSITSEY